MPADEIRQTRTLLEVRVPRHWAAWSKLSPSEESADLLKWGAILLGDAHQAGNDIVEADQFRGAVRPFHAQKDFCRLCVIMHAEVKRALAGDFDFLGDVVTTVTKG
jgi:hypothetical protein